MNKEAKEEKLLDTIVISKDRDSTKASVHKQKKFYCERRPWIVKTSLGKKVLAPIRTTGLTSHRQMQSWRPQEVRMLRPIKERDLSKEKCPEKRNHVLRYGVRRSMATVNPSWIGSNDSWWLATGFTNGPDQTSIKYLIGTGAGQNLARQ